MRLQVEALPCYSDSVAPRSILLLSPDGMLGRAWEALLKEHGLAFDAVSWPAIDFTKPETIEAHVRDGVSTVVNCSAFTDVDGAETREDEATAINGAGVAALAARCRAVGALLVHFSTDYVFEGDASEPYRTDHALEPINAYGRSKAVGEQAIRESGCEHLIVRTSWLYAPWAKNFVLTMRELGSKNAQLRVVDDQLGRPTSAEYLAARTLALVEKNARGTFHVTDGGQCTWFEFATLVMKEAGLPCEVVPCSSAEYVRAARRPAYSVLDLTETEELLGPSRSWRENVADVIRKVAPPS
jgi:dTDP-4-dehydrorhamnose reductase